NKKQHDIIESFYCYHRFFNPKSRLFLIGSGTSDPNYAKAVKEYPDAIGLDSVIFPGHISDRQKAAYYTLADVFVCLSEHEGFCVPLLEAMQYKVPIIAFDSSAVPETLGKAGLLLKNKKPMVVAEAINRVMRDAKLRETLVANGLERLSLFAPARIAPMLLAELADFERYWKREKTLYFDVTVQRGIDRGTGVQRVEKEELKGFYTLDHIHKIVPFYFDEDGRGLFECETGKQIQPHSGDIIYSSDLSIMGTAANAALLDRYFKKDGVAVWFLAYDLIPIRFPETCTDKTVRIFRRWLHTAFRYSGIISISQATMQDIQTYLAEHPELERNKNLRLTWSWIGCNFAGQAATQKTVQLETDGSQQAVRLLMVSTVEPRKMYDQVVKAFNLLKGKNKPVRLDIVGREGWKVEKTVALINDSPYLNTSLFWHKDGISDEELAALYQNADGIIVASRQEGFGLAVTEGAYYGKPLILRDIPVFREIAGDNATYFSGFEPEELADTIEQWLDLFREGKTPSSTGIHLTTWQEHCEKVLAILNEKE
ncbi:MAG: glycosyltransferase, partial [Treponema sp.]|nr:glycosyltransferase [Treponema sp.]